MKKLDLNIVIACITAIICCLIIADGMQVGRYRVFEQHSMRSIDTKTGEYYGHESDNFIEWPEADEK